MPAVLILDGEPPERALAAKRATGRTAGGAMADALREIHPDLNVTIAEPYFSDHSPDHYDLAAYAGLAVAGASAPWSADRDAPMRDMFTRAFASGTPCFAAGTAMLTAVMLLGGDRYGSESKAEAGIAHRLRPLETHPMMTGRRDGFDAAWLSQAMLARLPEGATPTAETAMGVPAAFAYQHDKVDLWATLYQPQSRLTDIAHWLELPGNGPGGKQSHARAAALRLIERDPVSYAALITKQRVGVDLLDRAYHLTELRNWVEVKVLRQSE